VDKDTKPGIFLPLMKKSYSPEEISSMILVKMKNIAED
jgi:molecular chaperone DnaK (HSP70)